jgi:uncharacterized membrane protein YdbT with pleckstrin-like domain
MAKPKYSTEGASPKDKKRFVKYLTEDEELILATGFGRHYLRQLFVIQLLLPGIIFILLGVAIGWYSLQWAMAYGILLGFGLATLYSLLKTILTFHSNRYLLTTRRVIIKKGYFTVKLTTALFDKITHIEVDQGFIDRLILHHGTIMIHTAGSNKDELVLKYVEEPIEFKNLLERLISREREQYSRGGTPLVAMEGEVID